MNSTHLTSSEDSAQPRAISSLSLVFIEEAIEYLPAPFCVNHKTELIDFNRRILDQTSNSDRNKRGNDNTTST